MQRKSTGSLLGSTLDRFSSREEHERIADVDDGERSLNVVVCDGMLRHRSVFGFRRLCTMESPPAVVIARRPCIPSWAPPVSTTPTTRGPYTSAADVEKGSTRLFSFERLAR